MKDYLIEDNSIARFYQLMGRIHYSSLDRVQYECAYVCFVLSLNYKYYQSVFSSKTVLENQYQISIQEDQFPKILSEYGIPILKSYSPDNKEIIQTNYTNDDSEYNSEIKMPVVYLDNATGERDYCDEEKDDSERLLIDSAFDHTEGAKKRAAATKMLSPAQQKQSDEMDSPKSIKYCRKCGTKLPPNSLFCNKCGKRIKTIK